jgi:hypothetical protein
MSDDEAYMALVTSNAQSELSALERGLHALHTTEKGSKLGRSVAAYAKEIGRPVATVSWETSAAAVYEAVSSHEETAPNVGARHLAEIHAAPRWLWPALVDRLQAENLPVVRLREIVAELKGVPEPLSVFDTAKCLFAAGTSQPLRA